jgi:hypothetical protein
VIPILENLSDHITYLLLLAAWIHFRSLLSLIAMTTIHNPVDWEFGRFVFCNKIDPILLEKMLYIV